MAVSPTNKAKFEQELLNLFLRLDASLDNVSGDAVGDVSLNRDKLPACAQPPKDAGDSSLARFHLWTVSSSAAKKASDVHVHCFRQSL